MGKRKLGWQADDVSSFFYPFLMIVMWTIYPHVNHYLQERQIKQEKSATLMSIKVSAHNTVAKAINKCATDVWLHSQCGTVKLSNLNPYIDAEDFVFF